MVDFIVLLLLQYKERLRREMVKREEEGSRHIYCIWRVKNSENEEEREK
jgi:hypothetical protein